MAYFNNYNGAALATYNRIQEGIIELVIDQVYESKTAACLFYINNRGFMRVLRPAKTTINGRAAGYHLIDYILRKDNTLHETSATKDIATPEALQEYMKSLINGTTKD